MIWRKKGAKSRAKLAIWESSSSDEEREKKEQAPLLAKHSVCLSIEQKNSPFFSPFSQR